MGANASTAVPLYASGQVLDAARLNLTNSGIPVFSGTATRDAAFGGSGEKVLAEGQFAYLEDSNALQFYDSAAWQVVPGKLIQQVNSQTGALATGTTLTPFDDTIPQNTEGTQFLSLAITPTDATNILYIQVSPIYSSSVGRNVTTALFQDSTANALAAVYLFSDVQQPKIPTFNYTMTAGTTSATTFKVRIGPDAAATITFNGANGARLMGGVSSSSITITEIKP